MGLYRRRVRYRWLDFDYMTFTHTLVQTKDEINTNNVN